MRLSDNTGGDKDYMALSVCVGYGVIIWTVICSQISGRIKFKNGITVIIALIVPKNSL